MQGNRTVNEINKRIKDGKAIIMTASELCEIVRSGEKITADDVDVVTSATRALMSGTMAIFSFRVTDKKQFERAKSIHLDGIPATMGPAPNENLGWIDCVVMGTARNINALCPDVLDKGSMRPHGVHQSFSRSNEDNIFGE
jgi:uncharacterized protein (DUF39 family)